MSLANEQSEFRDFDYAEARSVNEFLALQTSFRTSMWFIVKEFNKLTLKIVSGL